MKSFARINLSSVLSSVALAKGDALRRGILVSSLALAGVIEQYKLVTAGHGGKKETPTPEPESASEAGK